jgi:hypothetical protein
MRTSTTILEKLERLLTSPRWAYCALWHFPPMMPPPRITAQRAAEVRGEAEAQR